MTERLGNVLLVDDDPFIHRLYGMILQKAGYLVEGVNSGPDALARLKTLPWDVVVSDIAMPGMDGVQLLAEINKAGINIPVILMTAGPQIETAMRAVENRAFRYLQKPISIEMLLSVVAEAMRASRARRPSNAVLRSGPIMLPAEERLARFSAAMKELWIAYQPIVNWSQKRIYAQEALVRTRDKSISGPRALFSAAETLGQTQVLTRAIRQAAVSPELPAESLLCMKITAADLSDRDLYSEQTPLAKMAGRVILELSERASLEQIPNIHERVTGLRSMGYRIALDEMGAGYGALTSLALLEPEMIKMDRALVRDIHLSTTRQHLVRSLLASCNEQHTTVVAEGVESPDELRELIDLGVNNFQGFLFARPGPMVTNLTFPVL